MKSLLPVIILVIIGFVIYKAIQANKEETSESRTIKSLPPTVQHTVALMDTLSQSAFFNEYEKKKRKKSVAYIALVLIGWHYLYLRKVGVQFAYWFTLGGFGIWWIADLFRMPNLVRSSNEVIAREAIQTLSIGNQFRNNPSLQTQQNTTPDLGGTEV